MKKTNKGFTLVELIIVIAILAIIMLIAIPNFSGIQQRMQVRADKATAAQIGKAVRVWFTDYTTDSTMVAEATAGKVLPTATTDPKCPGMQVFSANSSSFKPDNYEKLNGIDGYISLNQKPSSLKTDTKVKDDKQFYGVFLTKGATDTAAKIAVAIMGTKDVLNKASTAVDYNGTDVGVAYVEP